MKIVHFRIIKCKFCGRVHTLYAQGHAPRLWTIKNQQTVNAFTAADSSENHKVGFITWLFFLDVNSTYLHDDDISLTRMRRPENIFPRSSNTKLVIYANYAGVERKCRLNFLSHAAW